MPPYSARVGTALGDFVRARRDATRPEALGLPPGVRRRVPGLRRSELASLAGVSVEYLTRIEQGRDQNPSLSVLNSLADALRLDATEREHLLHLAKVSAGGCIGPLTQPGTDVRPTVLALLDQFEPGLAVVVNRLGDLLAFTSGFELLAQESGLLDEPQPNLTRFVFTDDRARDVFPDWGRVADEQAFSLWFGPLVERMRALVAELTDAAGEEFSRRLNRPNLPPRGGLRWRHPLAGELRFDREVLELPPGEAQQVVVLLPADDATAAALQRIRRDAVGGGLRAVR